MKKYKEKIFKNGVSSNLTMTPKQHLVAGLVYYAIINPLCLCRYNMPLSSSGLGRLILNQLTRVRIPVGAQIEITSYAR